MTDTQRVAIVTGASHGIGAGRAGLVAGYRGLGYRVIAVSRSIALLHVDGGQSAGLG